MSPWTSVWPSAAGSHRVWAAARSSRCHRAQSSRAVLTGAAASSRHWLGRRRPAPAEPYLRLPGPGRAARPVVRSAQCPARGQLPDRYYRLQPRHQPEPVRRDHARIALRPGSRRRPARLPAGLYHGEWRADPADGHRPGRAVQRARHGGEGQRALVPLTDMHRTGAAGGGGRRTVAD